MSEYKLFGPDLLSKLIAGKIEGANTGAASVVVLLELLREKPQVFFAPGYMTSHDMMLGAIGDTVGNVGWAGRLSYLDFKDAVELKSGGSSIVGYRINRATEMQATIEKALVEIKKPSIKVVWAR